MSDRSRSPELARRSGRARPSLRHAQARSCCWDAQTRVWRNLPRSLLAESSRQSHFFALAAFTAEFLAPDCVTESSSSRQNRERISGIPDYFFIEISFSTEPTPATVFAKVSAAVF